MSYGVQISFADTGYRFLGVFAESFLKFSTKCPKILLKIEG